MVEERRNLGLMILLNIVTCGFYSWYFYYKLAQDMNTVCYGDGEETPGLGYYILFTILTCGIYSFFCFYKIGNRQAANGPRYNVHIQENGTTILVWLILGTWFLFIGYFVAMHIIIKNMNTLAYEYNKRNGMSGSGAASYPSRTMPLPSDNNYVYDDRRNDYQGNSGMETAAMPVTPSGNVNISCVKGEFAGYDFPLNPGDTIIIGRDNSCNIRFDSSSPNLSRRHCMINYDGSNVWITDMGSSYGTFLANGTRLTQGQKMLLQPGMGFYLGSENISFYRK